MRTQLFGGLEISCRHVLFFRSPFFSCKHYDKLKFYIFFPSVIRNDVHAFFLLKNSTAPPGTPIPPLNDKKARKKKYEWSIFCRQIVRFYFPFPKLFFFIIEWGERGRMLETLWVWSRGRARIPKKRARSLGITVGSKIWVIAWCENEHARVALPQKLRVAECRKVRSYFFPARMDGRAVHGVALGRKL